MKFEKKIFFFFFFFFFSGRLHFSLGTFKGEISAPRATISPQSPSSLFPVRLFINKELEKSLGTAALTLAVTCEPLATPRYGVNFFGT